MSDHTILSVWTFEPKKVPLDYKLSKFTERKAIMKNYAYYLEEYIYSKEVDHEDRIHLMFELERVKKYNENV